MSKPMAFWPLTVASAVNDRIDVLWNSVDYALSIALGTYYHPAALAEEILGKLAAAQATPDNSFIVSPWPAGRNLLSLPEMLSDTGSWARTGLSAVSETGLQTPDGSTTYYSRITEDTSTGEHKVEQTVSLAMEPERRTDYTYSISAAPDTRTWLFLALTFEALGGSAADTTYEVGAYFDLANQAVGNIVSGANGITVSARIVKQGGATKQSRCIISTLHVAGWRLVKATAKIASGNGVSSYTGTSSRLYAWGAKVERGSIFSGYVPQTWGAAIGAMIPGRLYFSWLGVELRWKTRTGANAARSLATTLGFYPSDDRWSGFYRRSLPYQYGNGWAGERGPRLADRERPSAIVAQSRSMAGNVKTLRFAEVVEKFVDLGSLRNYKTKIACEAPRVALDGQDHKNEAIERLWREGYARFRWWDDPESDYSAGVDYVLDLGNGTFAPARDTRKELYSVALSMRRYL